MMTEIDQNPTNRELKLMLDNQTEKFVEKIDDVMRVAREVRDDVKQTKVEVLKTNGRVTNLEMWSKEAQHIIENTTHIATKTAENYRSDRIRIWTAIALLTVFGGTIITLAIMAINSKIRIGIDKAFNTRFDKVEIQ